MAVQIEWQPPVVLEVRKQAKWEKIIRLELGDLDDDTIEVSLRFEEEKQGWMVEAAAPRKDRSLPTSRERV